MFPIYEVSAAPHFPQALKSAPGEIARPEAVVSLLLLAIEGGQGVKIVERDGELHIAPATS